MSDISIERGGEIDLEEIYRTIRVLLELAKKKELDHTKSVKPETSVQDIRPGNQTTTVDAGFQITERSNVGI